MASPQSRVQFTLQLDEIEVLQGAVANAILQAEAHLRLVSKGGPADMALRRQLQLLIRIRATLKRSRLALTAE